MLGLSNNGSMTLLSDSDLARARCDVESKNEPRLMLRADDSHVLRHVRSLSWPSDRGCFVYENEIIGEIIQ